MLFAGFKTEILSKGGPLTPESVQEIGHTRVIGNALFTEFIFPFEIASLILLVAMFGAIILAGRGSKRAKGPGGRVDLTTRRKAEKALVNER